MELLNIGGMKVVCNERDRNLIASYITTRFIPEKLSAGDKNILFLLTTDECEPLYLDCDATELGNAIMEIERIGFTEIVKGLFQGSHPYRSDTGKCSRCYRYRPEIHYDNEHTGNGELCNRCSEYMRQSLKRGELEKIGINDNE